jgi:hypothetical protein
MVERNGWKAIEIIAVASRFASQRPCSAQPELAGKRGEAPRFPWDRQGHPLPIGAIKSEAYSHNIGQKIWLLQRNVLFPSWVGQTSLKSSNNKR